MGDFGESRSILNHNQTEAEKEHDSVQWGQRMTVLGTVAYMAPELVNAERQYTEAIDVYAMGITFWEIWTGKDPFAKENTFSLYQLVAQGSRPEIPSTCPQGFEEVLRESWQASADQRPSASVIAKKMSSVIDCFKAALPETTEESMCRSTAEECTPLQQESISSTQQKVTDCDKVEVSFQFDDMYDTCDPAENDESHTNPLKLLFLKSLKKKT